MNSKFESEKFNIEPIFDKTLNDIKGQHLKIITSIDMTALAIASNKSSLSCEHLKSNIVTWILLK